MKSFKTLTNTLFEQGPPSRLKQTTTAKPVTVAKAKPETPKPEAKAGEILTADTKRKASINSFSTIALSDVYDSERFAVKMNNLYSSNSTVYTKVKDQLLAKGYKFKDRFNVDPIDFYHQEVSLSRIKTLAPEGQTGKLYWPVIRELFKNYGPAGDTVGFNTIKTLQKAMTVTFKGGAQKTFDTGMEYFLTRLKQANSSTSFGDAEARCFLAFICTLAPSALAELTAYANADQNFSSVSDPESIILGEMDVPAFVNFYKIFVQGVRKSTKGDNWTIDAKWVIDSGFAPDSKGTIDNFFKMVDAAVTGNYIDEALPKIKAYSAPSTGFTPTM